MRVIVLFIIFCLIVIEVHAQEYSPVYSQYMFNGLTINPAYAGSREVFTASAMHRSQWVGFEGAPVMQTISLHAPLKKENIGLGILLYNEKIGIDRNMGFYTNYAYRIRLGKGKLAFGLKAGIKMKSSNYSELGLDENVFSQNTKAVLPNFGFGFYYYSDKFFFGGSIPLLLTYNHMSADNKYKMSHDVNNYNIIATTGVLIGISNSLKIKPSLLFKYHKLSPFQLDINNNFIINDLIWVGASYRLEDAIVGILEYQVNNQLKIGYSYDYYLNDLQKYNSGSHEILVQYEFGYKIRAVNPRYF